MNPARPILLVEDNSDDELLTIRSFRKNNILNEIIVARDGAEALTAIIGKDPPPQLILLDLNLPRVSGLDVLRRIRSDEVAKHVPVVVLTSSKEEEDIIKSYALGANAYVRKPVDFAEFQKAVLALGLFWLILNETAPSRR